MASALAFEVATKRDLREGFDTTSVQQARQVATWWFQRRWGRRATLTAAQVKLAALACVPGTPGSARAAREAGLGAQGGAEANAFWAHRRSARDGGAYGGRGFGGFSSG